MIEYLQVKLYQSSYFILNFFLSSAVDFFDDWYKSDDDKLYEMYSETFEKLITKNTDEKVKSSTTFARIIDMNAVRPL